MLRWGGCPPPSSQGDASPSSSWDGAWCPDLVFRTQVLEYDRVIFTATQSHSALWLAMHFQAALKYKPYALVSQPLDLSVQPIPSLKSELPPSSFKDHINMKTSNSEFPNDTDTQDDLGVPM